jgi:hypothetical protein
VSAPRASPEIAVINSPSDIRAASASNMPTAPVDRTLNSEGTLPSNRLESPAISTPFVIAHSPMSSTPSFATGGYSSIPVPENSGRNSAKDPKELDFSSLELICPINADEITNRWLNPYVPVPGQVIKDYHPRISDLIFRILKSYVNSAIRGNGFPPFLHSSQVMASSLSLPLANCLSFVRVCQKLHRGSEGAAVNILHQEMNKIFEQHTMCNDMDLLATFQAYLIYAMAIFFRLNEGPNSFLRQAMMNLQELACLTSRRGLMCLAEDQHTRPKWEAWIVAEAKRRALFTMYLFDNILSRHEGLPTFLGSELQGLLAPASKALWEAKSRHDWEAKYNIHLAEWPESGLSVDELWSIPSDWGEPKIEERRKRVDQWLEDIDEFGVLIYTVTSCTHGG